MDKEALAAEFAQRKRSRLWAATDPEALAGWVVDGPEAPAMLEELPDSAEDMAFALKALDEPALRASVRTAALSLIGLFTRVAVPEAGATAGKNWLVTVQPNGGFHVARLTVGLPEVAVVVWDDEELSLILRIAATPLDAALASGELDAVIMRDFGIERLKPRYKTQAQDAARYQCNGVEAADWFLGQGPVRQASRLMCARLVLDGRAPHVHNYDVSVAAQTWAAAEATAIAEPDSVEAGFDRPYGGRPREAVYPEVMNVGARAREAAIAEHHALCLRLIAHLGSAGVEAGELHEPPVDLAWRDERGVQMIAEVKSCLGVDDTMQVRLGLGQVLEYRQRLAQAGTTAEAVLLVGRVPDALWFDVCAGVGVRLLNGADEPAWPAALSRRA